MMDDAKRAARKVTGRELTEQERDAIVEAARKAATDAPPLTPEQHAELATILGAPDIPPS